MDSFLAQGLSALASQSTEQHTQLRREFDEAMALNADLFGDHAFRKSLASGPAATPSVINISLFEVCAVTLSGLGILIASQKAYLRNAICDLLASSRFANAITYSTNSTSQVRERFAAMEKVAAGVSEIE